ncbi:MAG TPA: UDP-N-acetylmuramoyl-L-alanyl-D-glutamate--2,6-diaminopimelate ligase, partial [Bacteroidales bacterium]|nr:UDP-N-acetylmuramoyl-L-alanyl-D-glutamate--2,6-diaminopimelate ligase [Bacteroidales bacterium]
MLLTHLLDNIHHSVLQGSTDIDITNIRFDSRLVCAGDVFVATVGTSVDGHDFIENAVRSGAVAIVCQKRMENMLSGITYILVDNSNYALALMANAYYGQPSTKLTLVGVTGTNGKTTIATLLYKLTMAMGFKTGLLSTVCNYINEDEIPATHTTPDALQLNALLKRMVDHGCQYAFMEVSSHAADQDRIAGLHFRGGIFTNLTRDHIDYHKTFDNYLHAKQKFFNMLPDTAFAVTNKDDRNG